MRRVLIAECRSENDVDLAWRLIKASGIDIISLIVRVTPEWKYLPSSVGNGVNVAMPESFPLRRDMWAWVIANFPGFDEGISIRLYEADLPEDALDRAHDRFTNSGRTWALADYRQFTPARFEFFSKDAFARISDPGEANIEANLLRNAPDTDPDIFWPDEVDCRYFYKERFAAYFSTPQAVVLDLYPGCNKTCGKCQYHSRQSPLREVLAKRKPMPPEFALRVIREAASMNPKPSIGLTISGEPLLYPHLETVIREAKQLGLIVGTFTNGLLLSPRTSKMLVDQGLDWITISIDAFNPDTYAQLQPPGCLEEVKASIDELLALRGERTHPRIGVHFVVDQDNLQEFDPFLQYWVDRVDEVSRALRLDPFGSWQTVLPEFMNTRRRLPCWSAWTCLYVRSDGSISYCGCDIGGRSSGLSLKERPLTDCWRSEEFWKWREAQLSNDFNVLFCNACSCWSGKSSVTFEQDGLIVSRTPITEVYRRKE